MFNTISNQVFYTLGLYDIWNMLDNQQKETLTEAINIGIDEGIKQVKVEPEVKVNFAEDIEKQMLEQQLVKVKVLSCNGDPYGEHLPTKILLQLGGETKWFIQV